METLNLTQVKEAFNYLMQVCKNDKSEVKEVFKKLTNFTDFEGLKESLNNNDITISEFLRDEYYHDNNLYYSYDYYVMTREGNVESIDEANFCEYYEEYTSQELTKVHIGRDEAYYCDKAINDLSLHYYDGSYYDYDALDRNDLVIMNNGEIEYRDYVYFWESDNEYHYEEEEKEEEKEEFTRYYHHGDSYFTKNFEYSPNFVPRFFVGLEIEKYDLKIKQSININDFEEETGRKWRKEEDGSLKDSNGNKIGGYELVSPTMPLMVSNIEEYIRGNKQLVKHINAGQNKTCGGHINVSEAGKTGEQLFNDLKGFTPLFHALYYNRVNVDYSKGKSNKNLLDENEKYQSIKIHDNRIEYRIIGAVKNVNNLMWRLKLIDFITKNQTSDIKQAFFLINTTLKPLLAQVYNTNEKFEALMERIVKYTLQFEDIELAKINGQMFIEFNEEATNS